MNSWPFGLEMEGKVLISPKLVLDTCDFFLLWAPYVLDKFYDYHRSLKHTDTQSKRDVAKFRTHRAESSFTSKWYKPQEKERAAFISRPWAKGVSRRQEISGVNGPSFVWTSAEGTAVAPRRGTRCRSQGKRPGYRVVTLRCPHTTGWWGLLSRSPGLEARAARLCF